MGNWKTKNQKLKNRKLETGNWKPENRKLKTRKKKTGNRKTENCFLFFEKCI